MNERHSGCLRAVDVRLDARYILASSLLPELGILNRASTPEQVVHQAPWTPLPPSQHPDLSKAIVQR